MTTAPVVSRPRPRAHRATRDDVLATRTGSLSTYYATSDAGVGYDVLGPVPGDADAVYAVSLYTGQIVLVQRTGSAHVRGHGAQVRVRILFATDTGDAAGTLAFDPEHSVGGVAPRVLFA